MAMNFNNNPQLKLAHDFVEQTGMNIFLTGRAGTGKTTFLQYVRSSSFKRSVVVAPTGQPERRREQPAGIIPALNQQQTTAVAGGC